MSSVLWVGFEGIGRKCTSGGTWLVLPCATALTQRPRSCLCCGRATRHGGCLQVVDLFHHLLHHCKCRRILSIVLTVGRCRHAARLAVKKQRLWIEAVGSWVFCICVQIRAWHS